MGRVQLGHRNLGTTMDLGQRQVDDVPAQGDAAEARAEAGGRQASRDDDLAAVADSLYPHGGEGGLDRVGGAQMDPVLGREVVEGQQRLDIVGDLRDGLGDLAPYKDSSAVTASRA